MSSNFKIDPELFMRSMQNFQAGVNDTQKFDMGIRESQALEDPEINVKIGKNGGQFSIKVNDKRVLEQMLRQRMGESYQNIPTGQGNGGDVSMPGSPQSFPNQQAYFRQQAGEMMAGARPENPNEVPMKQKFLNALQDMGNYQFDPRAGWGNVVNALGAGARGAAVREEQYQNSMKWYQSQLADIQNQLQRNEIDMQEAQAKAQTAKAYALQAEGKHAAETKKAYLDSATTGMPPSTAKFYQTYYERAGIVQKDSDGKPFIEAADKADADKRLANEGSPERREWLNAQIADMDTAIFNAQQQMGQAKDPKAIQSEIAQMTQARDALRDERDKKASAMQAVEQRAMTDAARLQLAQDKQANAGAVKPMDRIKAMQTINQKMVAANKAEDVGEKQRNYEIADEAARQIDDPKLRAEQLGKVHLQLYMGGKKGDKEALRNYIQMMEDEGMSPEELRNILTKGMNIPMGAIKRALTGK